MGFAPERLADDARDLIALEPLRLLVVALARLAARLLAAPVEPAVEDLADVLGVVAHPEVPLDQHGDAGGSPQLVWPAVALGPLRQQRFQRPQLVVAEPGRGAGLLDGGQPAGGAGHAPPAVDGGDVDAQHVRDHGRRLAARQRLHGPRAASLQLSSGSDWSCHASFYAPDAL